MCLLFFEIAMFIVGLIALITGKFVLNKGMVIRLHGDRSKIGKQGIGRRV